MRSRRHRRPKQRGGDEFSSNNIVDENLQKLFVNKSVSYSFDETVSTCKSYRSYNSQQPGVTDNLSYSALYEEEDEDDDKTMTSMRDVVALTTSGRSPTLNQNSNRRRSQSPNQNYSNGSYIKTSSQSRRRSRSPYDNANTSSSYKDNTVGSGGSSSSGMHRVRVQRERELLRRKEEMAKLRGHKDSSSSALHDNINASGESSSRNGRGRSLLEDQKTNDKSSSRDGNNIPIDNNNNLPSIAKASPVVQAAAGVASIALIGAIVGPVGVLVGCTAVGLGVGVTQLSPDKQQSIKNSTQKFMVEANDKAHQLNEKLSYSCANACDKIGVKKVVKDNLPSEYLCESLKDEMDKEIQHDNASITAMSVVDRKLAASVAYRGDDNIDISKVHDDDQQVNTGDRRVAVLRQNRIVPVGQIHSLEPSQQPKAWLDVMASIFTSRDEKNEAMEEILILAKDKNNARMFLEEGILDSLMWILSGFFLKYSLLIQIDSSSNKEEFVGTTNNRLILNENSQKGALRREDAFMHARLASNCCVTLGKAHCAIVHTEGDLLLMSAYNRGSVPVERQLAQMLFEVPHHSRVTHAPVNQQIDNDNFEDEAGPVAEAGVFKLKEMTMKEAEKLAKLIVRLNDGRMDEQFAYDRQDNGNLETSWLS